MSTEWTKDRLAALLHALIAADEILDTQTASDWPDDQPISESLDFMTFGELRVLVEAARHFHQVGAWVMGRP